MLQTTIVVKGNVNDRLPSMQYLIGRLLPLRHVDPKSQVHLDLSKLRYLGPDGVSMIAGSVIEARSRDVTVVVTAPFEPVALVAFLEFSGFSEVVLGGHEPDAGHPDNVTVPLREFHQARHGDPEPIVELVSRFAPVSDDLRLSLEIAVGECVQNIEDHAASPIGGMGCARFVKKENEVRIALIDWGCGILTTLKRRHPDTRDDIEALARVLYGGFSAKSRANNAGRGIDNLRSVVTTAFGGNLFIVSGYGSVDIRGHAQPRFQPLPNRFDGTIVCFTVPVQPH